jgi:hypothetical protein
MRLVAFCEAPCAVSRRLGAHVGVRVMLTQNANAGGASGLGPERGSFHRRCFEGRPG